VIQHKEIVKQKKTKLKKNKKNHFFFIFFLDFSFSIAIFFSPIGNLWPLGLVPFTGGRYIERKSPEQS